MLAYLFPEFLTAGATVISIELSGKIHKVILLFIDSVKGFHITSEAKFKTFLRHFLTIPKITVLKWFSNRYFVKFICFLWVQLLSRTPYLLLFLCLLVKFYHIRQHAFDDILEETIWDFHNVLYQSSLWKNTKVEKWKIEILSPNHNNICCKSFWLLILLDLFYFIESILVSGLLVSCNGSSLIYLFHEEAGDTSARFNSWSWLANISREAHCEALKHSEKRCFL